MAAAVRPLSATTRARPVVTTPAWRGLFRAGAFAGVIVLGLVPVQAAVFVIWPPPATVEGFFAVFRQNAAVGLLNMDLLLMFDFMLFAVVFFALYVALRDVRPVLAALALAIEMLAVAIYFSSNTSFSMLSLSDQYAAASTDAERATLLGAGQAMLALYTGTAFIASYVLSGVAALLMGVTMLRSQAFSRPTAYLLIVYALLQVPPTAGAIGMALSLVSLVPMIAWLILVVRGFLRLSGADVASVAS